MSNKVLKFINDFKKQYPLELEDVFCNGYCYWFSDMLCNRFNGEKYYLPIMNHFITRIGNDFYDIKGKVIPDEEVYMWKTYNEVDFLEYQRILRDCVFKET